MSTPSCPICHSGRSRFLFAVRSPFPGVDAYYDVFRCGFCYHRWCVGDTSPRLLSSIYSRNFHNSSQQSATFSVGCELGAGAPVVMNAGRRAKWLTSLGINGRLIDIGAGNGYFVRAATHSGFIAVGIDLSVEAAVTAKSIAANVRSGDFMVEALDGPFDVATAWDVLSGMPEPHAALNRLAELLNPTGWLIATVADGASVCARLAHRYWPLMIPPVNVHFFSRESMIRLLRTHGFSVQIYVHQGKRVSVRFAARKFARLMHSEAMERAFQKHIPASWVVSLNLGDIATVIARKTGAVS